MWADCSENPANQWKQAPQSAVNAHQGAINNRYLRDDKRSLMKLDNAEATNNHSLNRCLTCDYNIAFVSFEAPHPLVTFEAPPPPPVRKKVAEKVKHHNRLAKSGKKATAPSNKDGKAMAYAQPFASSAKGLDKPLALSSESNQRYPPVDGTSLVGNSLHVKDIKQEPAIVLGNAPKESNRSTNVCMQRQHQCKRIRLDDDSSNNQSVHAYPLVKENCKTSEVIESPPIKLLSKKHLTSTSIAVVDTISSVRSCMLLKVLFDPGSTSTLISCKCLLRYCKPCAITNKHQIHTLAGTCSTKQMVVMRKIRLPKFNKHCVMAEQKASVFDGQCK